MDPQSKFLGGLYLAWCVLLLVTSLAQKGRTGRNSCLLGAGGFMLLGVRLFVSGWLNLIVLVLALVVLVLAGALSFRVLGNRGS